MNPFLILRAILALILLTVVGCPLLEKENAEGLAKRIRPAVVRVIGYDAAGKVLKSGSGFYIGKEGQLITTRVLLMGVCRATVMTYEGREYPIKMVVAEDKVANLIEVLVDVPPGSTVYLPVAETMPQVGDRVIAVGRTEGLEQNVSEGAVLAVQDIPGRGKIIQVSVFISSGSVGGPILSPNGKALGVASIRTQGGQEMHFAIPGAKIKALKSTTTQTFADWTASRAEEALSSYYERALADDKAGRPEDALHFFRMAVRFRPDNPEARNRLGVEFTKVKRYREAADEFRQAVELKPDYPSAQFNLGWTLGKLGDQEGASKILEQLKSLDPKRAKNLEASLRESSKTPEENLPELVKRIGPAVLFVQTYDGKGKKLALGSGFFLSPEGVFVTNFHVLRGASGAEVKSGSGRTYKVAKVLAEDKRGDIMIGIIESSGDKVPYLPVRKELPVRGDRVIAVGNPLGLEQTVSDGIVAAIRSVNPFGEVIQITAPISQGSSGGPVLNLKGEVLGLSTFYKEGGQNLNFAVTGAKILSLKYGAGQTMEERGIQWLMEAKTLTEQGRQLREKKNYKKAAAYLLEAMDIKPDYADPAFEMGVVLLLNNQYGDAVKFFNKAISLEPQYEAPTLLYLGLYELGKGDKDSAISRYKALQKLNPELANELAKQIKSATAPKGGGGKGGGAPPAKGARDTRTRAR